MDLLFDGDPGDPVFVLAHGAGAAMDGRGMTDLAVRIAQRGILVVRFEFGYMAARRSGVRRPPPRAETLIDEYLAVVTELGGRPVVGGRSMGGRVASLLAAEHPDAVAGVASVSYPWHPPAKPDQPRTAHLREFALPMLVVQGTRDPFGSPDEVAGYDLSPTIELLWLDDGDHDLRPRKAVSGFTAAQHLDTAADAVAAFVRRVSL